MKTKSKKNGGPNGDGRAHVKFKPRPKPSERTTRAPVREWDRIRISVLLIALFGLFTWNGSPSLNTPAEAIKYGARSYWWLLVLLGLEVIRQAHYFVEEHVKGYYAFWNRFTDRSSRVTGRIDPWTKHRLTRLAWVLFLLWMVGVYVSYNYVKASGAHPSPLEGILAAPRLAFDALPTVLQFAFIISLGVLQFVAIFWFMSKGGVQTYMPDDIETRFSDVKGQDAVLDRVKENMIFLEDPESIEERGGYVPGGVLLWGPPGTGKTLIAQAVAGETARPFVFVEPGAFNAMFFGVGILKVKGLYRKLRKLSSRYGGVIVFFDEADSLGNRGMISNPGGWGFEGTSPWTTDPACNGLAYLSDGGRRSLFFPHELAPDRVGGRHREQVIMPGMGMAGMGTLQALLAEMSGLKKPRGFFNRVIRRLLGMKPKPPPKFRILHIFATNLPQALDEAMLRPGRVDRIYKVGYPHMEGRKATFEYYFAKVRHELTDEQMTKLSTITPYATGASIQDMVNEALVIAIRDGRETITWRDVIRAKQLKEHGLPDDHEYIRRERHSVAIHEACHAVVAYRLRKHMTIDLATIERRGDVGGFVSSIPPEDQFVQWRSERDVDVMTFLASLAGERLFFEGDNTTGVGGDMRGATALATGMLAHAAMGETIAARSINLAVLQGAQPMETGADRRLFDSEFGKMVEAKLQALYRQTWDILEQNEMEVLSVGHALETHKTITGDDVAAIVDGTQGSLVDGRPYHDPRFRDELKAYHATAVQALHAHGDVTDAMPIPVPPPPVDVGALTAGNGQAASERPGLPRS